MQSERCVSNCHLCGLIFWSVVVGHFSSGSVHPNHVYLKGLLSFLQQLVGRLFYLSNREATTTGARKKAKWVSSWEYARGCSLGQALAGKNPAEACHHPYQLPAGTSGQG